MKAWAVTEFGAPLQFIDLPAPNNPVGREVLVDVVHCGICHTDVLFWEGTVKIGDDTVRWEDLGVTPPFAVGHEVVGRVSAVGPEVTDVEVGEIRLLYPWIGCGECADCEAEQDNLCNDMRAVGVRGNTGGFASQLLIPDEKYLLSIGDLDPAVAATYACSGLTVYSGIQKLMPVRQCDPVIVIGAGGLGLNAVSILKALEYQNIVVVDISDENLAVAAELGASATVNSRSDDPKGELQKAAKGRIRAVIDLVNSADTAQLAYSVLSKGGKLVQIGLYGGTFPLPLVDVALKSITISGSYVGNLAELNALLELAKAGKLPSIPVAHVCYSQLNDAMFKLRDGHVSGRLVLDHKSTDAS